MSPNPCDALAIHKFVQQVTQFAMHAHGLVRSVAERPACRATMDVPLEHPIDQANIKLSVHEDAWSVIRHNKIPQVLERKHGPLAVNSLFANCRILSRGLS